MTFRLMRRCAALAAVLAATLIPAVRADASILVNKAFAPTSVNLGITSDVTITLSNTSILSAANITSLSDDIATMGGHAVINTPSNIATTCAGGTASIAGTVVSLAGGVIPEAADSTHPGTCTVTFTVVGASVGNGINTIAAGALITDQGTNATAALQTLQVLTSTLTVAGSSTTSQLSSATATQTFTITNPTASAITNATFPISLTNGGGSSAQFTMTSGSTGACAGTVSPASFTSTLANPSVGTATVTGLTIPAAGSCTITLSLTDPALATNVSATGTIAAAAISDDQGVTNNISVTGKSQFFNGLATIAKSFTPSIVVAGATSRMTVTIKNTQTTALTNVALTDTMPTYMTLDATPAAAYTNCGVPTLAGAGTATLSLTTMSVAATTTLGTATGASTCTIVVTVDASSSAFGSLVNTIPAANLTDTQNVAAAAAASATLAISAGALNATKSFSAGTTVRNVPVTETLTFSNGSASALNAGTFIDNLPQTPVAMTYYTGFTPTFTNCGASSPTVTPSGVNTIVTGTNLIIPASSSCVVKFQVTLASGGYPQQTDTNAIPTANVTFTDSGSNPVHPTSALSATLATLPAFTIKNFVGPNYGGVANQPVTVQGQIVYSPSTPGLVTDTNVSATFVLNPGATHNLKLSTTPNFQFTGCPGGTTAANVAAAGNNESFVVTLASISATCTITYNVVNENTITPPSAAYSSGTDSYTSTENGGTSTTAAQTYTVTFYTTSLLINKVFSPNSIASGGTATAKFTIDVAAVPQLASTQANGVAFTDSLPANMAFAVAPNVTLSAGCTQTGQPTATGTPSGTTIGFANISLLAGTDCVATFDVTSNYLGNTTNTIAASGLTSTSGATNSQSASASLTVVAGVALQKTFLNSSFAIGDVNYVRFLVINSSGGVLSSGTLTDAMPATLALASLTAQPPAQGGDPASCGGTVSGTIGSNTFQLSGMSVAGAVGVSSPGECVQYVQVRASSSAAPGSVVNTIPAGALTIGGQSNLTGASSPPASVTAAPNAVVTQAFSPASIVQAGVSTLTITIANTSGLAAPLSGVGLTDTLPSGVTVAPTPNASTTCGGTVTAVAGGASAVLANGSLAANASCTITFDVTSAVANTYTNALAAGTLATTQGATNALSTAGLTVTVAPNVVLGKAFAPASIAPGGTSVLTLTVANTTTGADSLTNVALTDTFPGGLTVAAIPGASTTCSSGTLTAVAGAASVALAGATLAATATCTVTVNVTTAAAGSLVNTIPANAVSSAQGASNAAAATATLGALTIALNEAFAAPSIPAGTTSVLTITIPNTGTGAIALSGMALSDALPSGVTLAATPNATTTCGAGTVSAVAGGTTFALANGSVAASATCTISVTVTSTVAAVYANVIPASALTTTQGISNSAPATANLTVTNNGIALAKAFAPATINAGGTSVLTITIPNTAVGAVAISGVAVTDTLPSGVTIAATPAAATTCGAGTVTAVAGGASVALAAGSLAANATCTVTVTVTSTVAAAYTNTIPAGALTTTQSISNTSPASAVLTVNLGTIALSKAFAPATIVAGGTSTLTITVPNTASGAVALSGLALTDALPSGVTIAATPNAATTCGAGTVTAVAGGSSVALAAGSVGAGATCTVTVSVRSIVAAGYTNTIPAGALTTTQAVSNLAPASAILTVGLNGITLAQAFAPASIPAGSNSTLTITIPNTATGAVALSGLALSDALPAGVTISAAPNASTTCAGTVTAVSGSGTVALAGGSLGANASCTITVNVTGTAAATYTNTIPANALTTAQSVSNPAPSAATLTITLAPTTLTKAFAPASIAAGGTSVLTITIPNSAVGAVALSNLALSDALPAGVTIAALPNAATTCGAGSVAAVAGGSSVALANGSLGANASCTISVTVTGNVAAAYVNTIPAAALTNTQGVSNTAPATAGLTIALNGIALTKTFAPASIPAGGASTLTITIPNNATGAVALSALALVDTFPAGVTVAAAPNASSTCGGTLTAVAGGTSVALSGGALAANATCTISLSVTSNVIAAHLNTIAAGALTDTQGATNSSPAAATLTAGAALPVTLAKAFSPASISRGGISVLTLTLANTAPGAGPLSNVALSDTFPAGLTIAAPAGASTTCTAGTLTAVAGATSVALGGAALAANASCTVTVNVTSSTSGSATNTIAAGAVTSAQGASNGAAASATLAVAFAPVTIATSFTPATIASGTTSILTITLANTAAGASGLTAVALNDALPAGMKIAATPNAATTCTGGVIAAAPGAVSLALSGASIAANASCTVTVTVTSTTLGVSTNTIAAGAVASTQGITNAAPASATLTVTAAPAVKLSQTYAAGTIGIGGASVYTITIANTAAGAVPLSAIALTNLMPAGTLTSATPNIATTCPGGVVTGAAGATQISLSSATLGANASCTVSVNVTGPAPGTFVNTIAANTLTSAEGASNGPASQATLTIVGSMLQVAKTSDSAGTGVAPGGTVIYTIVVKNTGPIPETHATVTDTLANATFVPGSFTVNGTATPDSVFLQATPFGSIAPGASATLVYSAVVSPAATPGGAVGNSVTVSGDQPCLGATCSALAAPVSIIAPVLTVVITIDGLQSETVVAGQIVTYAMTVTNTSPVTATNVDLLNTAPSGATPIAGTVTLGGQPFATARGARGTLASSTINGQIVNVPIGTLAAGANTIVTFQATMANFGTVRLIDSASVSANGTPSVVFSNEVAAVMVSGTLKITKIAGAAVATVGDRVNYVITVAPPGGVSLGATTIVDTLPAYEAYAPGTARLGGVATEPAIAGRVLTWTVPTLTSMITLSYSTAIVTGAQPQSVLTNTVTGSAAGPRGAPPATGGASASIQVVGTTFGSCYPITGRVFVDVHDSGRFDNGDRGVANVRLYMEDGESVVTDPYGRYNFPCVRDGMHAMRLDTASLPAGITPFDDRRLDSTRSTRRLIHAALDATILQDINFAVRALPADAK